MQGDMYSIDTGQGPAYELGILPGNRFEDSQSKGRIAARQQLWRTLYNALILCQFQNPGVGRVLQALDAVTGWDWQQDDLLGRGMRIVTLKRLLNLRRGLCRADEHLPELLCTPLANGTEGNVPNLDSMLAGAYAEYGWDLESGHPSPEAVRQLGL
jgi:aldehyde:ferredoxin oxidoreductase